MHTFMLELLFLNFSLYIFVGEFVYNFANEYSLNFLKLFISECLILKINF